MYKKANRAKLRFTTTRGMIVATEDLYDLEMQTVKDIGNALHAKITAGSGSAFFTDTAVSQDELRDQLRFEIVKDVIETRTAELVERAQRAKRRVEKQKIMGIIGRKRDAALEASDIADLEKMLEDD